MKKLIQTSIFLLLYYSSIISYAQIQVTTFAGSGQQGSANGTGANASFYFPYCLDIDASGNVFVTDYANNLIRKITPGGTVSTFAGSGQSAFADGTGTNASFNNPQGLTIDANGYFYVTDLGNSLVRKITPSGAVTSLAGCGFQGSANGTGTSACFFDPMGIVSDAAGNIYVADQGNRIIRKITPSGTVSTFAGSGSIGSANGTGTYADFSSPVGLAIDAAGNLYVADGNNLIRKITPDRVVTTFAGAEGEGDFVDGTGTNARFSSPSGIDIDALGNLYIADLGNHAIRKITPDGVVTTLAGTGIAGDVDGNATEALFNFPSDVAIDASGNLYVADLHNNKVRKISLNTTTTSTKSLAAITEIKFYPIPASNLLTLGLTLKTGADLRVELINSEGVKVANIEASCGMGYQELNFSVQHLTAGLYIANIYSGDEVDSQKILIAR